MFSISNSYDEIWKAIIRPPREKYKIDDLGLLYFTIVAGKPKFRISGKTIVRNDFQLKNKRNLKLECSFFEPLKRPCDQLPCVMYLHGNSSSRLESLQILDILLSVQFSLVIFIAKYTTPLL
jgi:hypothetical protein